MIDLAALILKAVFYLTVTVPRLSACQNFYTKYTFPNLSTNKGKVIQVKHYRVYTNGSKTAILEMLKLSSFLDAEILAHCYPLLRRGVDAETSTVIESDTNLIKHFLCTEVGVCENPTRKGLFLMGNTGFEPVTPSV